jgi:hypothetical protein
MCIIESGRDPFSTEIDPRRTCLSERQHLSARADREHAVAGDCERLDLTLTRCHREDPAVIKDRVRAGDPTGEGGGARAEAGDDEGAAAEAFTHRLICSSALLLGAGDTAVPRHTLPTARASAQTERLADAAAASAALTRHM